MSESPWRKGTIHDEWSNAYMRAEVADFFTPSRRETPARWTVVYRPAAVAVIPVTPQGRIVMIQQERIPARSLAWEFPAGQIDDAEFRELDPDSEKARGLRETTVRNELREEAGYHIGDGGSLVTLGRFYTSPGFSDEVVYLYLAYSVVPHPDGSDHEESEAITAVGLLTSGDIQTRVADGSLQDSLSLALFARATAMGLLPP